MALTKQLQTNPEFIDMMNTAITLISEKTDKPTDELWTLLSDKTYEDLKKSTRKKTKRAKTAYSMFSSDKTIRQTIKDESETELGLGDMSKLVSEKWKSLSDEDKKKYEKMAQDKNESEPVNVVKEKKPKKKTPYNLFIADKEVREKHKNSSKEHLSMMDINKLMIAEWKTMSDEDKQKYVELANKANSDNCEEIKEEVEVKEEVMDNMVKEKKTRKKVVKK